MDCQSGVTGSLSHPVVSQALAHSLVGVSRAGERGCGAHAAPPRAKLSAARPTPATSLKPKQKHVKLCIITRVSEMLLSNIAGKILGLQFSACAPQIVSRSNIGTRIPMLRMKL